MASAQKTRVVVAGASGETGMSIMKALLASSSQFDTVVIARPDSVASKPVYQDLAKRGASVESVTFTDVERLVPILKGADVVISCIMAAKKAEEEALIDACHAAGVGRYVPSFFATCCPPRGIFPLRDVKEDRLDYCKRLYLNYTVIDVGWWLQSSIPRVPSGRLDGVVPMPDATIIGDGDTLSAVTDIDDIGRWVARIIVDDRTLNKMVFAYNEVTTQNRIWAKVEELTGETIPRTSTSKEQVETALTQATRATAQNPSDMSAWMTKAIMHYMHTRGIRGDNTPEHAQYLGYILGKDLYPDMKGTTSEVFISQLLDGSRSAKIYDGRSDMIEHIPGITSQ